MIVIKPWGREYPSYANEHVAIWTLEINKGEATSLHCHPKKNTALIVLRGEVDLHFIRDEKPRRIVGLDKINIFRGRFHRTRAVTDGVVMLEVEAPDNKRDVLRLEDDYGRAGQPIEDATAPMDETCLQISDVHQFASCALIATQAMGDGLMIKPLYTFRPEWSLSDDHIFVTLSGGLNHGLVPPGDAIDGATLRRFAAKFGFAPNSTFLQIWKDK